MDWQFASCFRMHDVQIQIAITSVFQNTFLKNASGLYHMAGYYMIQDDKCMMKIYKRIPGKKKLLFFRWCSSLRLVLKFLLNVNNKFPRSSISHIADCY